MNTVTAPTKPQTSYAEASAPESSLTLRADAISTWTFGKAADFLELTKPRIAVMVLATVAVGYTLGCEGNWQLSVLLPTLVGVGLVASGSSALNQYLERITDSRMPRTADRPLPAGRLTPGEVLVFGISCGITGTVWLAMTVNLLTSLLTFSTLFMYVLIYTPLKRQTCVCTAIGAIPGALPPVLGWAAARGSLDAGAFALFAVLFLWQFPHFLAIAWMYRDQYERAGLRMLPRNGSSRVISLMAVTYAVVLIPASLLPHTTGLGGDWYALAAIILGLGYLAASIRFARHETRTTARGVLFVSLIYLPMLLLVLTFDHLRMLM
ncbi:MAG: heme o synthase [Planctomycetaceae bacterium]